MYHFIDRDFDFIGETFSMGGETYKICMEFENAYGEGKFECRNTTTGYPFIFNRDDVARIIDDSF